MSVWQFYRLSAWNPHTPWAYSGSPTVLFFTSPSMCLKVITTDVSDPGSSSGASRGGFGCFHSRWKGSSSTGNCLCTVKIKDKKWQLNGQCLWDRKYRITTIIAALKFSYSSNPARLYVFCPFLIPLCHLLSLVPQFHVLFAAHNMVSTSSIFLQQRKKTQALTFFPCLVTLPVLDECTG